MKKIVTSYTFDASAQTIDSADFTSLEKILLITNVTDQIIIYNFADSAKGGSLSSTTLTLEYDTTSMSDTDKLQIFVEVANLTQGTTPSDTQPVFASSLPLPTGASTSAKQDTIIGHVDGIEGLLTTIDADTGNISTKIDTLAGAVVAGNVQVDVMSIPTTNVAQSGSWTVTADAGVGLTDVATQTTLATINTKLVSGTDIGDVTINNASGASAVNIQDGGNTITVDGTVGLAAGTNNIGDVDILSIAAGDNNIGNVDIASIAAGDNNIGNVDLASAIPAGTNLIGIVSSSSETSTIYNGTTALTPKYAAIDVASSGNNTIVAAVTSKKIRVHQVFLNVAADVTVRWESGADGTALTGQNQVKAGSGYILPYSPVGWFETASGVLLNLELSGAVSVDGVLTYTEV